MNYDNMTKMVTAEEINAIAAAAAAAAHATLAMAMKDLPTYEQR